MIFTKDFLFIHVPRTGGMAVTESLLKVLPHPVYYSHPHDPKSELAADGMVEIPGGRHEPMALCRDVLAQHGVDITKLKRIVAVLRNPYELEVSRFSYLQNSHAWDAGPNQEFALAGDFEAFARDSEDHGGAARPIESYFELDGAMPENLRVLHQENLAAELRDALAGIGITGEPDLPRVNTTEHGDWQGYYTCGAEAAVHRRYRWVFDHGFYARLDTTTFPFAPAGATQFHDALKLTGPVRRLAKVKNIWTDTWVAGELNFPVRAMVNICGVRLTGWTPRETAAPTELVLRLGTREFREKFPVGSEIKWEVSCVLAKDEVCEVRLTASPTFSPGAPDTRELAFRLMSFEFQPATIPPAAAPVAAGRAAPPPKPATELPEKIMTHPTTPKPLFAHLEWQPDRMISGGWVYRIEHSRNNDWELGAECFNFYKVQGLVGEYERFFQTRPDFRPQRVFELGIWDGGSVAFWFDAFQPRKHVAVDITQRPDSPYFARYLQSKNLAEKIRTFWGVNQADTARLDAICAAEFDGPLDLVIDDASHLYEPTLASFQTLFPRLRPGGLYIIEDWAWDHWPEFQTPDHIWAKHESLTRLVRQLTECIGTRSSPIARMTVHHGFVVVERAAYPPLDAKNFELEKFISRRAQ